MSPTDSRPAVGVCCFLSGLVCGDRRIDPPVAAHVPLAGRNRFDRCRMSTTEFPWGLVARASGASSLPTIWRLATFASCEPAMDTVPTTACGVTREQAYVPAEQPPPSQGARLPPADAHPRRPLDPVLASPEGPQEPRSLRLSAEGVLSAENRLRSADDFRHAVRRGQRAGGPVLVVHLVRPNVDKATSGPTRVGFVVAKSVGPAVVRNRVKRRLRHLMRDRLTAVPDGSLLVIRALPAAADAEFGELAGELDRCLGRA